ncbi:DNA sulfur modification protein DndB [Vibrio parahaemolyticus]|uniref:DNA sulfur modification protein DndB n=3 Tax=Vibrio parahaemolyticus TaxID=670 RepID=UPI0011226CE4|nr:DNA sulfur modification protein DndB [Vibrio parahaemolyticus]EHR6781397.1 hypothetical protein [Vibrio parahaemolyticus]ELB2183403.1 hypothetical protein [Vibrio parahaemolyticus]TOH30157.1 hypothetical protein CGI83_08355 [Vibrio parahaemolyticus]TOJ17350.1 hypothetical protein CGI45_09210 [Vibrio parahaemolyticus]HAS6865283.1 hypothetical protein [Vibrio parahaemolyticus]
MQLDLGQESELNLTLKGSVGSFKVGKSDSSMSLDVKYLLTTVGLNFNQGSDDKLLKELAPVREIFNFKDLDFDEIMQRDIDDARVSSELIPYILDNSQTGLIKFFPPIVVVALPLESNENKPAKFYDKISNKIEELNQYGLKEWAVMQSGDTGSEIFRFEQPVIQGKVSQHDLVKFEINTSRCQLVIVDGQHRAMALLALYRNLKNQWSDSNRQAFESYYKEWTPSYIKSFDLDSIQLPMIICTIPDLAEGYEGDFDLKKASRSIFLTLNKNARKVSRSRNLLLDDADLVSSFMRSVLSKIKNDDNNILADSNFQIHNVELDQSGDRMKIQSPVAITGVTHLHYMIEHILLDSSNINGISKRDGRFKTRTSGDYFTNALTRLKCEDVIGSDGYSQIRRDVFTANDEDKLRKSFDDVYGKYIINFFKEFYPYACFSSASEIIKNKAQSHQDVHLKPMLFDGQGIAKIFESHRSSLSMRIDEGYFKHDVPRIKELKNQLDATNDSLITLVNSLKFERAVNLFEKSIPKKHLKEDTFSDKLLKASDFLYDNVFTTIAFQSAMICGFFTEVEKYSDQFSGMHQCDIDDLYNEYIESINNFFETKTFTQVKNLVSLFIGDFNGNDTESFEILYDSSNTFRNVVYPGEMQPDEWPKYRYLFLELWKTNVDSFETQLEKERVKCRKQVANQLYTRLHKKFLQDNRLLEQDLSNEQREELLAKTTQLYKEMLGCLSKKSAIDESFVRDSLN